MKKRTRRKLLHYLGLIVRFILKIIFIYPFMVIWFLLKQIYLVISDLIRKSRTPQFPNTRISKFSNNSLPSRHSRSGSALAARQSPDPSLAAKQPAPAAQTRIAAQTRTVAQGHLRHTFSSQPLTALLDHHGSLRSFQDRLITSKSIIGLILGARGSGKSALGLSLLENIHSQTSRPIYTMGFDPASLPSWITCVNHLDDIPNNSVVLIDESGITFSSRSTFSDTNKLLSELLFIARHKDLSIFFITQNSSNIEINAIRQLDLLLLKKASLLQKDFERSRIKDIYDKLETEFHTLQEQGASAGLTYIYSDNYKGFVQNSLPTFWSERVSKSYAHR